MYQFGADDSTMHGTWVDGTITKGTWVFKVNYVVTGRFPPPEDTAVDCGLVFKVEFFLITAACVLLRPVDVPRTRGMPLFRGRVRVMLPHGLLRAQLLSFAGEPLAVSFYWQPFRRASGRGGRRW